MDPNAKGVTEQRGRPALWAPPMEFAVWSHDAPYKKQSNTRAATMSERWCVRELQLSDVQRGYVSKVL